MEMLQDSPWLSVRQPARVPLLGVVNGSDAGALEVEIGGLLAQGFRTLKVKVGFDAADDARRVRLIQRVVAGRCRLRIDANQGYDREQGCAFAAALDPERHRVASSSPAPPATGTPRRRWRPCRRCR